MIFKRRRMAKIREQAKQVLDLRKKKAEYDKPLGRLQLLLARLQRTHLMRANTHLSQQNGTLLAAGMSFQALFGVFAGLFCGFAVFGRIIASNPDLLHTLNDQLATMLPGAVGENGPINLEKLLDLQILNWTGVIAAVSLLF
ncbi:MAG: hypothetical protein Q4C71_05175, partial [Microbacteriaceae bacterium]|nr:hypothetical protein [Microbacteriaceae bacterium]